MPAIAASLSQDSRRSTKPHYFNIDIVRFLSALMATCFHLCYINSAASFTLLWPLTWFGWVGVEVFFVISGVVIANSANGASAGKFLRGRVLRLYPTAWICATITLPISALSGETNLSLPYIRSLMLSPHGPWISSVYWTLAVEICFYGLVFSLLLVRQFNSINSLAMLLTCVSVVYLSLVTFGFLRELEAMNILLLRHGGMFALGVWIWLSTVRQLRPWECAGVVAAVLGAIEEIRLTGLKFLPRELLGGAHLITPIIVWGLLVVLISSRTSRSLFLPPPYAQWCRTLGLMTYPLYLIHDVLGQYLIQRLLGLGMEKWTALVAGVLSVAALSLVIVKLDVYVRYWLASFIDRVGATLPAKWVAKPN